MRPPWTASRGMAATPAWAMEAADGARLAGRRSSIRAELHPCGMSEVGRRTLGDFVTCSAMFSSGAATGMGNIAAKRPTRGDHRMARTAFTVADAGSAMPSIVVLRTAATFSRRTATSTSASASRSSQFKNDIVATPTLVVHPAFARPGKPLEKTDWYVIVMLKNSAETMAEYGTIKEASRR